MKSFFVGVALGVLEKIWDALMAWLSKFKRKKKQEETGKKVEDDVQSEKPRDEETRKNESNWLNS